MKEVSDGFLLAEEDFKLRGSGDLFGIKQSGDMVFNIADLKRDYNLLLKAKEDSIEFLNSSKLDDNLELIDTIKKSFDLD